MGVSVSPTSKYPWREWFATARRRKTLLLKQGVDFPATTKLHGMMQNVRKAARLLGFIVSVTIGDDWITVQVTGTRDPGSLLSEERRKGRGRPKE